MKKTLSILIVVLIVVLPACLGVGIYNGLVVKQEAVTKNFSNIDAQLQRRADLIPNLVNAVKGYMAHEKNALIEITRARAELIQAQSIAEKANADVQLSGALSRLMAIVENYPDLKANTTFIQLQDELAGTENRITVARRDYNMAVEELNLKIKQFPGLLVAPLLGFKEASYFKATEDAKVVPNVNL